MTKDNEYNGIRAVNSVVEPVVIVRYAAFNEGTGGVPTFDAALWAAQITRILGSEFTFWENFTWRLQKYQSCIA
jgi:hypothetical protein